MAHHTVWREYDPLQLVLVLSQVRGQSESRELSEVTKDIVGAVEGEWKKVGNTHQALIATLDKRPKEFTTLQVFPTPQQLRRLKYVNTPLIKRSGIANATERLWPGALLMEGLGHQWSRLEWRVPRGWERRSDPWRTTSACRPLTTLTVMNGESCLCISTIIYTQTAEIAHASHQGRTHSLHFSSPHRPAVKYEASSQEDGAPSESLFFFNVDALILLVSGPKMYV